MKMDRVLITRAEYDAMNPFSQGFAQYWEGEWPGSELKGLKNPYTPGSIEHQEWGLGELCATLEAQDSES